MLVSYQKFIFKLTLFSLPKAGIQAFSILTCVPNRIYDLGLCKSLDKVDRRKHSVSVKMNTPAPTGLTPFYCSSVITIHTRPCSRTGTHVVWRVQFQTDVSLLKKQTRDQRRRQRHTAAQQRQLDEERTLLEAELTDTRREMTALRQQLGTAQKENLDLSHSSVSLKWMEDGACCQRSVRIINLKLVTVQHE